VDVPVLQTARLVMRGFTLADFGPYAAASADPEVQRFLGGPVGPERAWRSLAMHIGHWELRGYGQWALERRDDGRTVGRAGLWNPEGWFGVEVGWRLNRDAWGQGYATEAAAATIEWTWANLDVDRIISVIDPANTASVRVAERLGMHKLRDDESDGRPVVIMAVGRPAGSA